MARVGSVPEDIGGRGREGAPQAWGYGTDGALADVASQTPGVAVLRCGVKLRVRTAEPLRCDAKAERRALLALWAEFV